MKVVVRVAVTADEAKDLRDQGYIPVECSYGDQSVVDDLVMDHHNDYWHLEPVSLRAYRDWYGVASKSPRFVVGPKADLDATFAIAALAGHVPHPSHKWAKNDPAIGRDLTRLAEMIARRDDEPLFVLPIGNSYDAKIIACWDYLRLVSSDSKKYGTSVRRWWELLTKYRSSDIGHEIHKYKKYHEDRIKEVKQCKITPIAKDVGFVSSGFWGFDQWLQHHKIIVSHDDNKKRLLISARDKSSAIELFGHSGLLELRKHINGVWGGRASLLFPSKDQNYERDEAKNIANYISTMII